MLSGINDFLGFSLRFEEDEDMTKDELKNRLESAEKQIAALLDEIKNMKSKINEIRENEIPEFPSFRSAEEYWFVDSELEIDWGRAAKAGETEDYNRFHSEDYVRLFADRCRDIAMLLHCKWCVDKELVTDFSNSHWFVWYDHQLSQWSISSHRTHESTTVYFTTREAAQKAADWMNKYNKAKQGEVMTKDSLQIPKGAF